MKDSGKLANAYRVNDGARFRLKDFDPGDTGDIASKEQAGLLLQERLVQLRDLQAKLYAQNCWAMLLIFQGMDTAGKDGVIKHVMSGVDPHGCEVYSFKEPSGEELNHDYLWRAVQRLPERRRIGIFNRSYYEEVLVVRIHPSLLKHEKIPDTLMDRKIWEKRFEDICAFERHLVRNGIVIRKFFLHLSKKEQAKRFLERLNRPEKNWKLSLSDIHERKNWNQYMAAYEDVIQQTALPAAPWFVVPADHKWFTRLVVASAIVDTLDEIHLAYPEIDIARRKDLNEIRKLLEQEVGHVSS
jgi:PPK2 family polyphosphate:nucleotide phosphotransferase